MGSYQICKNPCQKCPVAGTTSMERASNVVTRPIIFASCLVCPIHLSNLCPNLADFDGDHSVFRISRSLVSRKSAFRCNFRLGYNAVSSVLFLGMTVWKLVENHQDLHGKLTWKSLRNMDSMPPLLLAFVRDGSIFFALSVNTSHIAWT